MAFLFFWAFSFLWPFSFFIYLFLTWDNALIIMIITLLFFLQLNNYNSRIKTQYLEKNMTLCECLWRSTRMCNESRVTCMKNYERWLCHKYDVNYMIMQRNMTMMKHVIINGMVEVAWQNISRNGYGNAIIGRYGGCFEEGK